MKRISGPKLVISQNALRHSRRYFMRGYIVAVHQTKLTLAVVRRGTLPRSASVSDLLQEAWRPAFAVAMLVPLLQWLGLFVSEIVEAALFGVRLNYYIAVGLAQTLGTSGVALTVLGLLEVVRRLRSSQLGADFLYGSVALVGGGASFAALEFSSFYLLTGDVPTVQPDLPTYGHFVFSLALTQASVITTVALPLFCLDRSLKVAAGVCLASLLTQLAAGAIFMPDTVRILARYFLGFPTSWDFLGPNSSSLLWLLGAPYGPLIVCARLKRVKSLGR